MRLMVLGCSGQLARSLTAAADGGDITLTALGRPQLDLTRPEMVTAAILTAKPDAVINAAAYTAVDRAESEPEAAYRLNAEGPAAAARATAQIGVPLIHVSTDYVFDGSKAQPYLEGDPTGPTGVYGASKLAGEVAVAAANPRHVIVRTAWVFSPYGHNFLKTMLRLASERSELAVVDDQRGSPTYAPDLAAALIGIARAVAGAAADDARFGIYHATNRGEASWADFAVAIMQEAQRRGRPGVPVRRITTAEFPTPTRRPANSRLDVGRLARGFGIALPDWQDGLVRCLDALDAIEYRAGQG